LRRPPTPPLSQKKKKKKKKKQRTKGGFYIYGQLLSLSPVYVYNVRLLYMCVI
jgi:hypothetical protein